MASKKKPLTQAEKKFNAKMKKQMQEKGIIPPDKPKLNRKKFIEEAMEEWNNRDRECLTWEFWLYDAISHMLAHTEKGFRVSPEAVGVAKTLKLAIRLREFHEKLEAEGRDSFNVMEQYDFIKDILDA